MSAEKREYFGGSLNSFILALGHSQALVDKILREVGIDRIDPDKWYDFDTAIAVYKKIAREVGRGAVIAVGKKIIEAADFPPGIDSVQTLLSSLGAAYHLNTRGPNVGEIFCSFEDDHSATLEWSAGGPCALNFGIIEGCCARYGATALVEHGVGCMEEGAPHCIYHVTW